jgi:uncharacterized protein (DUF2237 family)
MLGDDSGNGGGRPNRNVLGDRLELCSIDPMTGFFRDGCCDTSREDVGSHTLCAVMTAAFPPQEVNTKQSVVTASRPVRPASWMMRPSRVLEISRQ